jgi:nitroimidazol reductase NimA-like FMN-containing flavoprotein (pyridoxamine 5'-phosphate oxidase superfamily)
MQDFKILKNSAWDRLAITEFLNTAIIPMRIAVNDAAGIPRLCSVWFGYDGEDIIAVSHENAVLTKLLSRNAQCAFEIGSNTAPYQGVRGQARVELSSDLAEHVLQELMSKYLRQQHSGLQQWLTSRAPHEKVLRLKIDWLSAWDYSERML